MPTVASIQSAVAWEIGSALTGGPAPDADVGPVINAIVAQLPALWDVASVPALAAAGRAGTAAYVWLRTLYMKLAAIDALLGARWPRVDVLLGGRSGARPSLNQEFQNLFKLRGSVLAEITAARKAAAVGGTAVAADMLTTAPDQPGRYVAPVPAGQPVNTPAPPGADPNWPGWRGDPRLLKLPGFTGGGGTP